MKIIQITACNNATCLNLHIWQITGSIDRFTKNGMNELDTNVEIETHTNVQNAIIFFHLKNDFHQ